MHNGKYQCHTAASCTTTYQLSSPRAIQKSLTLNFFNLRVFWKTVSRIDYQQKNDKTERARGLGRKTRGDRKVESNDSPEIPDNGGGIRHPQPCFGSQLRG